MGKRGPAPRPARLRLLDGARARDVNRNEPTPPAGTIEPPAQMSDDVRVIFERVVADLEAMQIAARSDVDVIVAYCEAVDKHRQASAVLARSPILVKGLHTALVRNPALAVQRDAANTIRQLAQELGLTPSARARIDTDRVRTDEDNPFSQGVSHG